MANWALWQYFSHQLFHAVTEILGPGHPPITIYSYSYRDVQIMIIGSYKALSIMLANFLAHRTKFKKHIAT